MYNQRLFWSAFFLVLLFANCNQKLEAVLPLVGLYEGRIIGCDQEQTTMIDSMMQDTVSTPFTRKIVIAYIDDFVSKSDSVVSELGIKPNKKFIVIESNWLCVKDDPGADPPLDKITQDDRLKTYPVVVKVTNGKKGRKELEMAVPSQTLLKAGGAKVTISGVKGFYFNAALQLEYTIQRNGRGKALEQHTMVGLKN